MPEELSKLDGGLFLLHARAMAVPSTGVLLPAGLITVQAEIYREALRRLEKMGVKLLQQRDVMVIMRNMIEAQLLDDLVKEREERGIHSINTALRRMHDFANKVLDD